MTKRTEQLLDMIRKKPKRTRRKQRTSPPPSIWWRSANGLPFKIRKTRHINDADEWLYRCDFGDIVGTALFAWPDLESQGCASLEDQPRDWALGDWRTREVDQWA